MIVDISYTVKASEANGRRLMKDIDTGRVFWETDEQERVQSGPVVVDIVPGKPKKGKRREKKLAI